MSILTPQQIAHAQKLFAEMKADHEKLFGKPAKSEGSISIVKAKDGNFYHQDAEGNIGHFEPSAKLKEKIIAAGEKLAQVDDVAPPAKKVKTVKPYPALFTWDSMGAASSGIHPILDKHYKARMAKYKMPANRDEDYEEWDDGGYKYAQRPRPEADPYPYEDFEAEFFDAKCKYLTEDDDDFMDDIDAQGRWRGPVRSRTGGYGGYHNPFVMDGPPKPRVPSGPGGNPCHEIKMNGEPQECLLERPIKNQVTIEDA